MHPRRRRRTILANFAAAALLAAYGASLLAGSLPARADTDHAMAVDQRGPIPLCSEAPGDFCVIDGDTIRWQGAVIRLLDIDAPEIFDFDCESELALGRRATERLRVLLAEGPVELVVEGTRDQDRYGRKLRIVGNGATSFGNILVTEGLARAWDGRRRPWCARPDSALR